jgi:mono/diheme cytochrome c family protein
MSLSRYRNLSYLLVALAAACGDGDPLRPAVVQPEVADPNEDAIIEQEPEEEPVAVEPDEIGLPCDVKAFVALHCQGCHGAEAKNGTPLLTHENLVAASKKDPTLMVAERMVLRMTDPDKPMPPAAKNDHVGAEDLGMFSAWIDSGMPAGRCDE